MGRYGNKYKTKADLQDEIIDMFAEYLRVKLNGGEYDSFPLKYKLMYLKKGLEDSLDTHKSYDTLCELTAYNVL